MPIHLFNVIAQLTLVAILGAAACSDDAATQTDTTSADTATADTTTADTTTTDTTTADTTATDTTATETLTPVECPAASVETGTEPATGDCVMTDMYSGIRQAFVRADCTDEDITASLSKRHMVMVPDTVSRDVLWVHFGGSGGRPSNSENIGRAAAEAGYRYISLAYTNEDSIAARCLCPEGPRAPECGELVRLEVIYGDDVTDMFTIEADEAIVPRLTALLRYLHGEFPNAGWNTFVDDGAIRWSKIAVSGFSQGGGMAGLVARDQAVDRAMFLSKSAGGTLSAYLDPAFAQHCTSDAACDGAVCCPLNDFECESPGDDAYCLATQPVPWAFSGADTNGDRIGDGDETTRATPPAREFAVVHRLEGAYADNPDIWAAWGMIGDRSDIVDLDTTAGPFGDAQVFSTAVDPKTASCSEHQSMGADGCQAVDPATGRPVVEPGWKHAMTKEFAD